MPDRIELPPLTPHDIRRLGDDLYDGVGLGEAFRPIREAAYRLGYAAGVRDEKNRPRTIGAGWEGPTKMAGDDDAPINPVSIGRCSRCGSPTYTKEGFCGGCRP